MLKKRWLLGGAAVVVCGVLLFGSFIINRGQRQESVTGVAKEKFVWDGVVRDTPVRVGTEGTISASMARSYNFIEAVIESDVVADITITSWMEELLISQDRDRGGCTFFNAKINYLYKGDAPDEIVIMQLGDNKWTHKNYPLFKNGDRLLLFLNGTNDMYDNSMYPDNMFWIPGSHTTVMDVYELDGILYSVDRWGIMTNDKLGYIPEEERLNFNIVNEETRNFLHAHIDSIDPVLSEARREYYENILFYDDVAKEIQNILTKEGDLK